MVQLKKRTIASLCSQVTSGGTPFRENSRYWANGTIPWFKTGELRDCWLDDSEEKITQEGLDNSSAKLFPINTVLMAMYGDGKTITSLGILRNPGSTNQASCAMIVDPTQCDYRFLFYKLKSVRSHLLKLVVAGAQRNLSAGIIKNFEVDVPSMSQQSKIADILSAYDNLIENNRRRIALLQEATRMLYREWFVHFRFPGHEHFKITNGLPEGWKQRALGEIATVRKGKNITKETVEQGGVPVVAGGLRPAYYHSKWNAEGPVITVSASGANAGYVTLYHSNIWASDCSFISSSENSHVWTLYLGLKARQSEITRMQQGAAQPHVYPKQLERLVTPIAPTSLGNLFEDSVDASFRLISNLEKQNDSLAQARELLLPRLMNGEIAV